MRSVIAEPVNRPIAPTRRARVLRDRENQSARDIRDRVWRAKIRSVGRIEDEEDWVWGLIAERIANDPNEESIPLEVVRRELGLDRPE